MKKTILALSLSIAAVCASSIALASSYACQTKDKNPNWCQCVHEYMSSDTGMCHQMGGDDDTCKDASIREIVKELGGPKQTCTMVATELQPLCMAILPDYIKSCPVFPD